MRKRGTYGRVWVGEWLRLQSQHRVRTTSKWAWVVSEIIAVLVDLGSLCDQGEQ